MPEHVIEISQLEKSFGDNRVLRGFDIELRSGENLVVLGRSGSGKSVLIKCIIRLLDADNGAIKVFGTDVTEMEQAGLDRMRAKIGFLFQSSALYDSMTVRENLEFPLRRHFRTKTRDEVDALVMEALDNVGLPETVDMMPSELSGGMRKRIGIARTLILKPEIMLYDEPTTGLDPITGKEISGLMMEVKEKYNTSSIIISHDMNCVKRTADRIAVLEGGICHAEGTYAALEKSDDPKVKQYFG